MEEMLCIRNGFSDTLTSAIDEETFLRREIIRYPHWHDMMLLDKAFTKLFADCTDTSPTVEACECARVQVCGLGGLIGYTDDSTRWYTMDGHTVHDDRSPFI